MPAGVTSDGHAPIQPVNFRIDLLPHSPPSHEKYHRDCDDVKPRFLYAAAAAAESAIRHPASYGSESAGPPARADDSSIVVSPKTDAKSRLEQSTKLCPL